jgi:lysyl-tRNA synthetase, class II
VKLKLIFIIHFSEKNMTTPTFDEIIGHNDQIEARREHLAKLAALIGNPYPNKFERSSISGEEDTISNVLAFQPVAEIVKKLKDSTLEGEKPNQELKESLNAALKDFGNVRVSGRLAVPPRVMGKAAFVHLSDGKERLQIYVRKQDARAVSNDTGETLDDGMAWEVFNLLDHGDFLGVEGFLFLTNTGELSVHVETLQFLAKALLPMPDKIHGISEPELQRRYRYADLIADSLKIEHDSLPTREVFERRARLISGMRNYLDAHGYIEVETPMLTPKATGAAAKPFKTHHNALDIDLYARIAPELYLKRLLVGGFEKVYELNRNFRNEGIDATHNPEFTMLEFYCAYMDVNGMMDFAEVLIKDAVQKANGGSLQVNYGENEIDFSKFERLSMKDAIISKMANLLKWISLFKDQDELRHLDIKLSEQFNAKMIYELWKLSDENSLIDESGKYVWETKQDLKSFEEKVKEIKRKYEGVELTSSEQDKDILALFEDFVEEKLIQPTFIIDYPKSISPLSKASPQNPQIAERFELFINGMECANGFSELNAPEEQFERFLDQSKERERGDEEAMVLDEDYIRALAYGMPPAAGIGIGIDRLVMLLTNRHSIRDVILFPHMRPERGKGEETATPHE